MNAGELVDLVLGVANLALLVWGGVVVAGRVLERVDRLREDVKPLKGVPERVHYVETEVERLREWRHKEVTGTLGALRLDVSRHELQITELEKPKP